ncbi:Pentatricopeptide repeat-containing protein At2g01860 [Linum perenne]
MEARTFSITLTPRFTSTTRIPYKNLRKNHQSPRRTKLPPDFGVNLFLKKPPNPFPETLTTTTAADDEEESNSEQSVQGSESIDWEQEEIEAITSLFQRRIPQKPGNPTTRVRPLPLPVPHKIRPDSLPAPKKRFNSVSNDSHKNPVFLIELAKQISKLPPDQNASLLLSKSAHLLRKGSLSTTIRELGHMGLPSRALETLCWAQNQEHLVPDDRILACTVEVLAKSRGLKVPSFDWYKLIRLASRAVIESMIRGFVEGGSLEMALKLVEVAKKEGRVLDGSVYVKLALELVKNPDKVTIVESLLEELAEEKELKLSSKDCNSLMKVCVKLNRFELVDGLFEWFTSSRKPSVVMYTTLVHSRVSEGKFRKALEVVWEMERDGLLFDLTAYRVVIKLFVVANDVARASRYFARLKEAGFGPTYDVYEGMVRVYMVAGRVAKCREVWKEAEMAGFRFSKHMCLLMMQLEERKLSL